jgi:hypothetical protein
VRGLFYDGDRGEALVRAHDELTREYIEALERVARAAYEFWTSVPGTQASGAREGDLYDALSVVDFM